MKKEKTYTIEEAKEMLHNVVLEESKKLQEYLEQNKDKKVASFHI